MLQFFHQKDEQVLSNVLHCGKGIMGYLIRREKAALPCSVKDLHSASKTEDFIYALCRTLSSIAY